MEAAPRSHAVPVRTVAIDDPGDLVGRMPEHGGVAWLHEGDGFVGWGTYARFDVDGPGRFARANAWWAELCATFDVVDEVDVRGTGPLAVGSFTFDDRSGSSALVVPEVVLGRRNGRAWLTTIGCDAEIPAPSEPRPPVNVRFEDGSRSPAEWVSIVADAVGRIRDGHLDKVVLARDVRARADDDVDTRALLERLSRRYHDCWAFSCDGLVGATPELLIRREDRNVWSRVLAGTLPRGRDEADDDRLAAQLLASAKDIEEHEYAARSASAVLEGHCEKLDVEESPHIVKLANVQHLGTDLIGRLSDHNAASALDLAGALHPTAAVCGTPTDVARELIWEIEGLDRARYAGPVGWLDADGDGEWCISLRCAEVDGPTLRLFAGCGIVADSQPDAELAEAETKLMVIRDALGGGVPVG
ncbi:MAG: isochorismate synthase [Actinomycetota bacterium]|nr:isochorismate synthase [Actinomycetota bacterium]